MNKYTDAYLIEVLNQFATKHNRLPVCLDMCPPYPSYNTYKRRFKSFTNALILAGLKSEFDHMYWSNLDTYEKWYYLGFIIGDGCIYVGTDKKGYQTLEFNIVGTKNVCECVQYLLSKYLNITNKSVYLKPGSNVYVVRWGKRSDIELISKFLYQHATLNNICLKRKQNKFKLISR
jgi:hypothetical protein